MPSGKIEIMTSADNLQLFFPEEYLPPAPIQAVEKLTRRIDDLSKVESELKGSLAAAQNRIDSLSRRTARLYCVARSADNKQEARCAPDEFVVSCVSGHNLSSFPPSRINENVCNQTQPVDWTFARCYRIVYEPN